MEKYNIFKSLDEFIFKRIDQLQGSSVFSRFNDTLATLEPEFRRKITKAVLFALILIPTFFVFSFYITNVRLNSQLAIKKKLVETGNEVAGLSHEISVAAKKFLPDSILSQTDLRDSIEKFLPRIGLAADAITIENFETSEIVPGLNLTRANISFEKFSIYHFSEFISNLLQNAKFIISGVEIERTPEKYLKGTLTVVHYKLQTQTKQEPEKDMFEE
jgi:hypothetical protein